MERVLPIRIDEGTPKLGFQDYLIDYRHRTEKFRGGVEG
jgi:hypothetical protein